MSNTSLCIKESGNWGRLEKKHKFDNKDFDETEVKNDLSPKMTALLKNIRELDEKDMKEHGHLFKHFIYSDIKSSFGAKLIASVLTSDGFQHAYSLKKTTRGMSFTLDTALLKKKTSNVFATLTSVAFFEKPIGVNFRKEILKTFNTRPDNVHGENIRVIILDSGFREGIDLFDVKYVHLVEPIATKADQKQAIGRGTRFCGQKGLEFHKKEGWPLHVYRYETALTDNFKEYLVSNYKSFENINTFFDLFMKYSNLDPKKLAFSNELETIVIGSAVDKELTKEVHEFKIPQSGGGAYKTLNDKIKKKYGKLAWGKIKIVNGCIQNGGAGNLVEFTPTQQFIREYFTPKYPNPGMLLYHSVGTGKTCTAIATASSTFEKEGYSIIYVTRYTLKADVWKNMFDQVCSLTVQDHIKKGMPLPDAQAARQRIISDKWFEPMSYRQFSNLLAGKNQLSNVLIERNGKKDILHKTLIIVDEAHKLFAADVEGQEKADIDVIRNALMTSNKVSGKDGAKILLMTATPYTTDAMDMIRLYNLCRPYDKQFPEDFEKFSELYLDENGLFTEEKKDRFYDDIAGYTSYLNREKDIRSFAYPVIHNIEVPMSGYDFADKFTDIRRQKMNIKAIKNQIDYGTHHSTDKLKKKELEMKTMRDEVIKPMREAHKQCVEDSKADTSGRTRLREFNADNVKACNQILKSRAKDIKAEYKEIIKALKADTKVLLKVKGCDKADIKAKLAFQINEYKNDEMFDIEQLAKTPEFIKCREDARQEYLKEALKYAQQPSQATCKEMLAKIKQLEADNKERDEKALVELKTQLFKNINSDKERIKVMEKELSGYTKETLESVEKDRSQQTSVEKCLKQDIRPQHRMLLNQDSNKFSDEDIIEEIVDDGNNKKNVFMIFGHGGESVVDFKTRNKVPEDKVVVVFPVCSRPNYLNISCEIATMFNDPKFTKILSNPIKYREKIENHIGHPIRIYLPNEYIPSMTTNLFMDFDLEDIVLKKSGVFRATKIPEINRKILPEIRKERQNLGSKLCKDFIGIISSPEKYNAKVHNEVFKGNLFLPALKSGNTFNELKHRKFKIDDIINTVGKGIYYYTGCRVSHASIPEAKYDEILKNSDNQQYEKHRSKKIRPILSLLNNSNVSSTKSSSVATSTTVSSERSSSRTKTPSPPKKPEINTKEEVRRIKHFKAILANKEDFDIEKMRDELLTFVQTASVKLLLQELDIKEYIDNNSENIVKKIIVKKVKQYVYFMERTEIPYKGRMLNLKDESIGIIDTKILNSTKKCSGTIVAKKLVKIFKKTGEINIELPKTIEEASSQEVFENLCVQMRRNE